MIDRVLTELAACLCEAIANAHSLDSTVPEVCFCGVVPGQQVALDYVDNCESTCGMAYVRLAGSYPSVEVGVADITENNCNHTLGFDVELAIVRCFEVPAEGEPPTEEQYEAAARLQWADMMTLHRAVTCCDVLDPRDYVMGQYTPYGPQGGVVGGFWPISVWVG